MAGLVPTKSSLSLLDTCHNLLHNMPTTAPGQSNKIRE